MENDNNIEKGEQKKTRNKNDLVRLFNGFRMGQTSARTLTAWITYRSMAIAKTTQIIIKTCWSWLVIAE